MESINFPEFDQNIEDIVDNIIDFNITSNQSNSNQTSIVVNEITNHINEQLANINILPKITGYQVRHYNGLTEYFQLGNQGQDINKIISFMSLNQKPQKISFYLKDIGVQDKDVELYLCQLRYSSDTDSFKYENFWNHSENNFNIIKKIVNDYFQLNY
jgi:hypothetical protein